MPTSLATGVAPVLAATILLLAGCGGTTQSQPQTSKVFVPDPPPPITKLEGDPNRVLTITQGVWDNYQVYLSHVGNIGGGFYMVTEDGQGSGSWACGAALCEQSFDGRSAATKQCEEANPGKSCVIFAKDSTIQAKYEIAP